MSETPLDNADDSDVPDPLPPEEELTSQDENVRNAAWEKAEPILKEWGRQHVDRLMPRDRHQDKEDVVAQAIVDFHQYLDKNHPRDP